jgi:hypothetical protein
MDGIGGDVVRCGVMSHKKEMEQGGEGEGEGEGVREREREVSTRRVPFYTLPSSVFLFFSSLSSYV